MKRFSKIALLICLALMVTAFMAVPASAASKGKLVKEHKCKVKYYENGKWTTKGFKYYLDKYKYNKYGDLSSITSQYCKSKSKKLKTDGVEKYKLTYKKGKLQKKYFTEGSYSETTYFKNGIPVKVVSSDDDGTRTGIPTYKSRYLKHEDISKETSDEEEYGESSTGSIDYTVKTKGGYPVKITRKDPDYGYNTVVLFYTKGDKKGLIKKAVEKSDDGYRHEYKFSYKVKKGLVTSYTIKVEETFSSGEAGEKYKETGSFKYTKKKAKGKRYQSMINSILCPNQSFFVTYW